MSIVVFGESWDVEYTFQRGRPGVHTLPNGDPGYPDEPDEVEIESVKLEGSPVELIDFLSDDFMEKLISTIIELEHGSGNSEDLSWEL